MIILMFLCGTRMMSSPCNQPRSRLPSAGAKVIHNEGSNSPRLEQLDIQAQSQLDGHPARAVGPRRLRRVKQLFELRNTDRPIRSRVRSSSNKLVTSL